MGPRLRNVDPGPQDISVTRAVRVPSVRSPYHTCGKWRPKKGERLAQVTPEVGAVARPDDLRSKATFSALLRLCPLSALVPDSCLLASKDGPCLRFLALALSPSPCFRAVTCGLSQWLFKPHLSSLLLFC